MLKRVSIDGVDYVEKKSSSLTKEDAFPICIIRTYSAGVFFGRIRIEEIENKACKVLSSRRIWSWTGACSISQIAKDGLPNNDTCKIAVEVEGSYLTEIIEVIPCTEKSILSIEGITEWKE